MARSMGYPDADVRCIESFLASKPGGRHPNPRTTVFFVDRMKILVGTEQLIEGQTLWGVSRFRRSASSSVVFIDHPEGHQFCSRHHRSCRHDEEGECVEWRELQASLERAKQFITLEIDFCECPQGHEGRHWPECSLYLRGLNEDIEALLAEPAAPSEPEEPTGPAAPARKPKADRKRVLPGQQRLL